MSDAEKKKKEMIEILERIPVSGSFERVKLTKRVSELLEQYDDDLEADQKERIAAVPAAALSNEG